MYTVAWVVALFALAWLVAVVVVWTNQERVVFHPPMVRTPAPADQRVEFRGEDGTPLFAYVLGTAAPGTPVVIAFHGNADLARWYIDWGTTLSARAGAVVVIAEYRGYDGVPGPPTRAGVMRDARAALDWVRTASGHRDAPIVYFGHSLGAAIAADLAAEVEPAALILQSPFSSARDMGRRMFVPGLTLFWRAMSRVSYDNVDRVKAIGAPIWVAHGDRDRLIPPSMGQAVFRSARRPGRLLIVPGAGHNDVDDVGGEAYWSWIEAAIRSTTAQNVTRSPRDGVPTT